MKRPPFEFTPSKPNFSDDEVEAFHHRLNALLNGRQRIVRLSDPATGADNPDIVRQNRIDLVRQAASLISDICGDWIKLSLSDEPDNLSFMVLSLRLWLPALGMYDRRDLFWEHVIDELQRMPFGDEPEILAPAKRPPGSKRKPAQLMFRKLRALKWAEFLKAKGERPARSHRLIALAYGTDWDAVRKWRQSAIKMFGLQYVEDELAFARSGYDRAFSYPKYLSVLHLDGAVYREQIGRALIEWEAFEANAELE